MAKPLETVMPAHTSAWYRDLCQGLHQANRYSSELAWSLDSLGPLPTLPPDVFTEQSHFSITTRFETGLEWLGPWTQPALLAASGSRRDHWRSRPWSLLLLVAGSSRGPSSSSPGLGVDLVGAPMCSHPSKGTETRGCPFPGQTARARAAFSGSSFPTFPRLVLGWDLECWEGF